MESGSPEPHAPPLPDLLVEKRGEGREGGILRYGRDEKDTV